MLIVRFLRFAQSATCAKLLAWLLACLRLVGWSFAVLEIMYPPASARTPGDLGDEIMISYSNSPSIQERSAVATVTCASLREAQVFKKVCVKNRRKNGKKCYFLR